MPPALPGFHYDAEKKKYFKIQPDHVAAHGSAARKYSKATLNKKAEERRESKRRELLEQRQSEMRLRRSKVLESPLGGGWGLKRELGVVSAFNESSSGMMMRAWAQGLRRENVARFRGGDGGSGAFVFDSATGVLTHAEALSGSGPFACFHEKHIVAPTQSDSLGREEGWVDTDTPLGCHFDSQVVSMNITPSRWLLTTSMGGSQPACVHLTKLVDPEVWRADYQDHTETQPHERDDDPLSYTADVCFLTRDPHRGTFWASSPRPDPTTFDFAIATTYGSTFIKRNDSSWRPIDCTQPFERGPFPSDTAASAPDVRALDWLDANVLLNGCRDGAVRLWDTRVPTLGGAARRFTHPSSINHVRRLGDCGGANRVVVAGLQDKMAVYDLRYTAPSEVKRGVATRPYVEFPEYRNRELNGVAVGFDVCGDLIAAGTDWGGCSRGWQVFDGGSGREVLVGGGGGNGKEKVEEKGEEGQGAGNDEGEGEGEEGGLGGPARCLQFADMEQGKGKGKGEGRGLFVAGGRGIERWVW